ncbi:MAG: hypothetical protein GC206_14610 [Alphaproteobacteria bacterium]|nr:hypothetical protein [Alphaproteobacteria bacterium]
MWLGRPLRSVQLAGAGAFLALALAAIGLVWISIWLVNACALLLEGAFVGANLSLAPLIVGGVMVAPLLIFILVIWLSPKPRESNPVARWIANSDDDLAAITRAAEGMVEKSPMLAVAIAALAGVLAARFPAALTILMGIVAAKEAKSRD